MSDWVRYLFAGRPAWMNVLMAFSAYMAFVYVPWDIFVKPAAVDEEVWFGVRFHGGWAKFLALFHWAVYAAGAYGFRHMKEWMWPWAAVYAAQVALSMLVWPVLYAGGVLGFLFGLFAFVPFAFLSLALWNARDAFQDDAAPLVERYGPWALVTGASAGIGAGFARALARDGVSVVLTARREERLRELAEELESRYHVETRCVVADLAAPEGIAEVASACEGIDLAIVVNNAGFGGSGAFAKQQASRLREMVLLNCVAPVELTARLLPGLLERPGRSAVIVTGSVAGRQALPLHAVYSATKAFDQLFGEALHAELRDRGVDVLVLEPGSTATEFQEVAGELAHPGQPVDEVVATALDALGRQPSVVAGWWNWLRANLATRLLPRSLVAALAREHMAAQTPSEMH